MRSRKALRRRLLDWYLANRRDLPWRRSDDPYAIWISETMLQQTRVETVIPYYERFLARFPDVTSLADADTEDVLAAWAGLGYYRRARNLQAAARRLADDFGGALPDDPEALRSLPGVGRYTAGAVASIAFDRPEPIVDGNVARVFARLFGLREELSAAAPQRRLWHEAAALARGPAPGDLNQALMELGATLCTPRAPQCGACPVANHCDAHAQGDAEQLPIKAQKATARRIQAVAGLLGRGSRMLAVRRPPGGLLGGLWALPGGELTEKERPLPGLRRALADQLGLELLHARRLGEIEHVFSHRRLRLHVYRGELGAGRVQRRGFDAHRWLSPTGLSALAQSKLMHKALALAAGQPTTAQPRSRAGTAGPRP